MHVLSNDGKRYVYILELHRNVSDDKVRDSVPDIKIATIEKTDQIDWKWIITNGYVPIVRASPTIVRSTLQKYIYTPEFWLCPCGYDFLHASHFACEACGSTCIDCMENTPIKFTTAIWGNNGPYHDIETSIVSLIAFLASSVKSSKQEEALECLKTLYKHLKAFDFSWIDAFEIENF